MRRVLLARSAAVFVGSLAVAVFWPTRFSCPGGDLFLWHGRLTCWSPVAAYPPARMPAMADAHVPLRVLIGLVGAVFAYVLGVMGRYDGRLHLRPEAQT